MKKTMYAVLGFTLAGSAMANASLTSSYQFVGKGNWSLDAKGENSEPVGSVRADVPAGSTIEKAFLYSSKIYGATSASDVTFDGTTINAADWTPLGIVNNLQAFRKDVTSQVQAKVGGGGGVFNFSLSEAANSATDGEALVVVYSNPAESERTIALLDGYSDQDGDTAYFHFASPLVDPNAAGFEALMSLGIGFSAQGSVQYSTVDVNGDRLTTSAGGHDDGILANGGLITIGGIDDSPANPADPNAFPSGPRSDDELYTLTPFLNAGDTLIKIDTANPSHDDNIFFWGINITAKGEVTENPNPGVPEPGELALLAIGMMGTVSYYLRRRKA